MVQALLKWRGKDRLLVADIIQEDSTEHTLTILVAGSIYHIPREDVDVTYTMTLSESMVVEEPSSGVGIEELFEDG